MPDLPVRAEESLTDISEDFLYFSDLKEKLPKAVCDETVVLKAPSLEPLRVSPLKEEERFFLIHEEMAESKIMSFLLGDGGSLLFSPQVKSLLSDQVNKGKSQVSTLNYPVSDLNQLKQKTSLEICTAIVTPGKFQSLFKSKPSLFLPAKLTSAFTALSLTSQKLSAFRLFDLEERFGKIGKSWWIPGWVEPFEVESAWTPKRIYKRLTNPLTHRTQYVLILNSTAIPLGFLFVTNDSHKMDWNQLKRGSVSGPSLQKRNEVFRLLIEEVAYRKILLFPQLEKKIKNLHEKSKSKFQELFRDLKTPSRLDVSAEQRLKTIFESSFFESLKKAHVNGLQVGFQLFLPEPGLEKILQTFRKDLDKLQGE